MFCMCVLAWFDTVSCHSAAGLCAAFFLVCSVVVSIRVKSRAVWPVQASAHTRRVGVCRCSCGDPMLDSSFCTIVYTSAPHFDSCLALLVFQQAARLVCGQCQIVV